MYKTIGLAIGFSPNTDYLIKEAERLRKYFCAKLLILFAGIATAEQREMLDGYLLGAEIPAGEVQFIEEYTEAEKFIKQTCKKHQIDLLILGARSKEGFFTYYTGSIARKIMRDAPCSLLILTAPKKGKKNMEKICASVDFSTDSEEIAKFAHSLALLYGSTELVLLREFMLPGLAITVHDNGSRDETEDMRKHWQNMEFAKLEMMLKEIPFPGVKVRPAIVYGREGFEASAYAKENNVDLLVVPAQKRKFKLFDRVFQHDQEFFYQELPCSLMCLKTK
ncbi:MAG: universal stress protein [Ignavibacteriales bacterium]|nr:universal stress protein [Ignavibacteriales bacterium]